MEIFNDFTVVEGSEGIIDRLTNYNLPPYVSDSLVADPLVIARANCRGMSSSEGREYQS